MHNHSDKYKNYEADQNYMDMDGNLRTFTIRDYSKPKGLPMTPSTQEEKEKVFQEYELSIKEQVQEFIENNPPEFGREVVEATIVVDGKINWNPSYLDLIFRDTLLVDYFKLKKVVEKNILENIGWNGVPLDPRDQIQKWRDRYKKTKKVN